MTTQTVGLTLNTVRPWRPFTCHVKALRRLSPSFLRVTFASEELRHFADNGYDQRFKLIFPAPACGFAKFPDSDRWYSDLRALPDEEQCRVRTYTVRAVRGEAGEVDVDMVVHAPHGGREAPALHWALHAEVGSELVLLGPDARYDGPHGGIDFRPPENAKLLLGGDETAAPAIASILERLPITAHGDVFIEVPEAADALELDAPPEVEVHWLPRDGAGWGERLVPAVTEAAAGLKIRATLDEVEDVDVDTETLWDAPEQTGACESYVWIAAEAGVVKALRRTIRQDLGLPKECGAFMGYWRLGKDAD
ncbi:siderophore-interacting protein [Glycomyces arizonensis]|uniref:siderophore-interacting protein n=1 Tax=Glycomyces arizonensis TaxID=256035 RepID=UPI0004280F09|nr:siderophore-interacting protein [Glycomyces arizonensis]